MVDLQLGVWMIDSLLAPVISNHHFSALAIVGALKLEGRATLALFFALSASAFALIAAGLRGSRLIGGGGISPVRNCDALVGRGAILGAARDLIF